MERSLHSARACFVENLAPVLTSGEVAVLDSWYRLLDTNPDLDMEVDLVIYLQTSPEVSISRVQSRSRSEEQQVTITANIIPDPFKYFLGAPKVPAEFFYRMHGLHQDWLLHHNSSAQVSAPQVTLLDIMLLNLYIHKVQYLKSQPNAGSGDQR